MTDPTWDQLRQADRMVADGSTLRLAAYPTETYRVAIVFETPGAESPRAIWLPPEYIPVLVQRLQQAQQEAVEGIRDEIRTQSVKDAHSLIERVKRGE